jgi:hypothetical protein
MENDKLDELLEQEMKNAGITPGEEIPAETPEESKPAEAEEPKPAEEEPKDPEPEQAPAEEPKEEPATEEKAEESDDLVKQAMAEPELILGKFKSVDDLKNAYQNLEKQFTQKSQQTAEVVRSQDDAYWDNEIANAEDIVARDIVTRALDTIADPAQKTEAMTAMNKWLQTGDSEDLSKCLGYMDVRVERQVRLQAMDASAKIRAEATRLRTEAWQAPLVESLKEVRAEDPEWFDAPTTQEIIKSAIALNGAKLDVKSLKKMILASNNAAVERDRAKRAQQTAIKTEQKTVSVKGASHNEPPKPEKPVDPNDIEGMLGREYTKLGLGQ